MTFTEIFDNDELYKLYSAQARAKKMTKKEVDTFFDHVGDLNAELLTHKNRTEAELQQLLAAYYQVVKQMESIIDPNVDMVAELEDGVHGTLQKYVDEMLSEFDILCGMNPRADQDRRETCLNSRVTIYMTNRQLIENLDSEADKPRLQYMGDVGYSDSNRQDLEQDADFLTEFAKGLRETEKYQLTNNSPAYETMKESLTEAQKSLNVLQEGMKRNAKTADILARQAAYQMALQDLARAAKAYHSYKEKAVGPDGGKKREKNRIALSADLQKFADTRDRKLTLAGIRASRKLRAAATPPEKAMKFFEPVTEKEKTAGPEKAAGTLKNTGDKNLNAPGQAGPTSGSPVL